MECSIHPYSITPQLDLFTNIFSGVPENASMGTFSGGALVINYKKIPRFQLTADTNEFDEWTHIGVATADSQGRIQRLHNRAEQSQKIIWTHMTLSLCD